MILLWQAVVDHGLPNPLYGPRGGTLPIRIVIRGPHRWPIGQRQYPIAAYAARTRIRICNQMGLVQPGCWAVGNYIFSVYLGTTPMVRGRFAVV